MAKIPSQWTPQEAWSEAVGRMSQKMQVCLYLPFPSDPPEVVSEGTLRAWLQCRSDDVLHIVARELLARREAERKA